MKNGYNYTSIVNHQTLSQLMSMRVNQFFFKHLEGW